MKQNSPLLGAHMSIAKGFDKAITDGESIGCTAIQIFTHSNRQWHIKPLTQETCDLFKDAQRNSSVTSVTVHASYLINVGSPDPELFKKSVHALKEELLRCEQLGIPHLVLHPGSATDGDEARCITTIAQALDAVFDAVPGHSMILLENSAGQGSAVGCTFEQLADIRAQSTHKKRIGFCFDTCHAFVAGYDFATKKSYDALWKNFDNILGLEHLKAIHLNDSKKGLGSKVDRHEDIGKGTIPLEAFALIMNDPRLSGIPKLLETPNATLAEFKKNIDLLLDLLG